MAGRMKPAIWFFLLISYVHFVLGRLACENNQFAKSKTANSLQLLRTMHPQELRGQTFKSQSLHHNTVRLCRGENKHFSLWSSPSSSQSAIEFQPSSVASAGTIPAAEPTTTPDAMPKAPPVAPRTMISGEFRTRLNQ